MKVAMVIQNSLRSLGGGEMICVTTCLALQRLGYHVKLVTDRVDSNEIDSVFGMGDIIRRCEHVGIPSLGQKVARLSSVPGLLFAWRLKKFFENQSADLVFVTRDPRRPGILPDRPLFRFVYEIDQLTPFWKDYRFGLRNLYSDLYGRRKSSTTYLALSSPLAAELKETKYENTELIYPSYGWGYRPRPKKNQVVSVTFLAPQKAIEEFNEIARRLPQYQFLLVGRDTSRVDRIYHGYASRVLANKPSNVKYFETRIRQTPELLEESKIYLHTSKEPGLPISVMEALSAGCMPVAPVLGGGSEVLEAAGVGFLYDRIDAAVTFIESELDETKELKGNISEHRTPREIAERARIFSVESFQERLKTIIAREYS